MKIAKRGLVQILPTYLPTGRVLFTYMEGFSRNRGVYSPTGRVLSTFSSTEKVAKPQKYVNLPTYLRCIVLPTDFLLPPWFTNEKNESLWKIDRKITKNSENRPKIAKSGRISTIFVEISTKHQARAYSGREALNRAQREAFRGKSQVGGNPENPGF